MNDIKQIPCSCNKDCGGGCPLIAHIQNNKIIKITDNKRAPEFVAGCPRGYLFHKVLYSKNRLLNPLKRIGSRGNGKFKEISWNEAYDLITDKIKNTLSTYGAESIMPLAGSGSLKGLVHNAGKLSMKFFSSLGDCTWYQGSYSSHTVSFAQPFVLGTLFGGVDVETLKYSKQVILWGANISDTRFGSKTENVIKYLKSINIPIIVVDPRRTKTVEKYAAEWIKIKPASDTALMSAVAYILIKEELTILDFINKYSVGFEKFRDYILGKTDGVPKTPEWAENICGLTSKEIRNFALKYASHKPTALIPGLSIQRTIGGEDATRVAIILQTLTGNIALKGGTSGGMFGNGLPSPFVPSIFTGPLKYKYKYPVNSWADIVLEGCCPDIKIIYNIGNNYLNQGPDINKNIKAFNKADFIVTHDSFLTPTARFSDIVLPTTMWPERDDVIYCLDNYICYSQKAVESPANVKNDYAILADLSARLDFYDKFTENKKADEWLDYLLLKSEIDDISKFKETGIYEGKVKNRMAFNDFFTNPDKYPLKTPSGLIEISSEKYAQTGYPAFPECRKIESSKTYPLTLITPHAKYRINSSNDNIDYFKKLSDDTLWINCNDAIERGITDGIEVILFNQRGSLKVKAKVTENIIEGTVCLNQGIWAQFKEDNIPQNAPNILTSTSPTMPSEGPRTHLTFVDVKK
jgi:anaerobic dimethyl sulfoxide reductase subunit A